MEKKNTGLIVVLVIFIILSLALGGFILYDKVLSNDNTNETKEKTVVEKNEDKEEKKEIISYVSDKDGIPYINLDYFESVNEKISEFKPTVYAYHVFKNILFVSMSKGYMVTPYEGGIKYLNVYVDLDNNKVLTTKELFDKLSVSKDHMNDSLKDYKDIDSIDLDNEVTVEPCDGGLRIIPQNMGTFSAFEIGVN